MKFSGRIGRPVLMKLRMWRNMPPSLTEREELIFAHFKNFKVKSEFLLHIIILQICEPVDEVMLLESVKDDGDPSAEQTRQSRLRKPDDAVDERFMSIVQKHITCIINTGLMWKQAQCSKFLRRFVLSLWYA